MYISGVIFAGPRRRSRWAAVRDALIMSESSRQRATRFSSACEMMRRGPATRLNSQTCSLMGFNEMSAPRRISLLSRKTGHGARSRISVICLKTHLDVSRSSTRSQRQKCDVHESNRCTETETRPSLDLL